MADLRVGFRPATRRTYGVAGDRKLEVVNGRVFSTGQAYLGPPSPSNPHPTTIEAYQNRISGSSSSSKAKKSSSSSSSSSSAPWSFNDPEMKRRKRVAKYKMYAMEGKMKASFRKGFRWIKYKCSELVHGW